MFKNKKVIVFIILAFAAVIYTAVDYTTYTRLKTTGDPALTGSNGETIDNSTDGQWDFGAANLTTTGTVTGGATTTSGQLSADSLRAQYIKLGTGILDSYGATNIYLQNKSGAAITKGDVVVWDNTAVEVVAEDAMAAALTIAEDLDGEEGYFSLYWVGGVNGDPDAGDTVFVIGTTYEGGASDVVSHFMGTANTTTGLRILDNGVNKHFSLVDSIYFNTDAQTGVDTVSIYAMGVGTVKACDGANTDIAGVCAADTIADNGYGYITTHGIALATVDAASNAASPGVLLEGASGGDAVVDPDATTGKNLGRALEFSGEDNKQILIFVDQF